MTEVVVQANPYEFFLKNFKGKDRSFKYRDRVSLMVATSSKSLVVDYDDISRFNDELASRIVAEPDEALQKFDSAVYQVLGVENVQYAQLVRKELKVRIRNIAEKVPLRQITSTHLLRLISLV